jgi:hypothetical protein
MPSVIPVQRTGEESVTLGPFTPQYVRAHISSITKYVFEAHGVGTLSLIQRQGHVWGRGMVGRPKIQERNLS